MIRVDMDSRRLQAAICDLYDVIVPCKDITLCMGTEDGDKVFCAWLSHHGC